MNFLDKLDYKYGRKFGLPNLMIYITATMLAVFVIDKVLPGSILQYIGFSRAHILRGEIWRIVTFLFEPTAYRPITLIISLYFYYFIGNTLENTWGACRFTIYYMFGAIGAILGGFIAGGATNAYLNLSLFFAFAQLFPEQQVLLFFIIPIKIKYLAWANWFIFVISFFRGGLVTKVAIVFSLLNFFLFFGKDIFRSVKNRYYSYKRKKNFKDYNDFWR